MPAAGGGDAFFGGGLGDLFDAFFGGQGNPFGGGQRGPAGPPRGQDLEVVADLTFEQAVFGTTLPVTVRTAVPCDDCGAIGRQPRHPAVDRAPSAAARARCAGSARACSVRWSRPGRAPAAAGPGQVILTPCPTCRGEGRTIEERTYNVDVPAGVDNGSTLRLTGRGAAGPRGGPAGDLYVHLRVQPHDRFHRDGYDLVADLPVSFAQAALGTHLHAGDARRRPRSWPSPPARRAGASSKLRGRGVPHVDGRGRGDLRVVLRVDTPTKLSATEQELLRRLAEERGEIVDPPATGVFSRIKSAFK